MLGKLLEQDSRSYLQTIPERDLNDRHVHNQDTIQKLQLLVHGTKSTFQSAADNFDRLDEPRRLDHLYYPQGHTQSLESACHSGGKIREYFRESKKL